METTNLDLMRIIQSKFTRLSKGQKMIADFILKHYDKAAFMTAAKLGQNVGVSESTVVRFAIELGYEGYPELQKSLQELVKTKLTAVQRLELTNDLVDEENALKSVLKADMENIRTTMEKVNQRTFDAFVDHIVNANKVYIIGLRSSSALSEFLGFYLNLILNNVLVLQHGMSDIYEQMLHLGPNDVIIGIGFPRYSIKTVQILKFARGRGAKVLCLTDSLLSPLAAISDLTVIAQSNMASFVDSLVAPMSIINAIIISVGLKRRQAVSETFSKLEEIWEENKVFLT
ncbi:MurR/RpiR family transcriptional regulator [Proteiniclasticum sp. QWL-01]|uniref:MurR/RpiR family transcriptional regulator n=1 Tax=Proteiniclasticum sp. QWL-01 TaxID=3036945 RepID=UPI00220533B9|nr:MurR/RpiR family transcriptional regulator [Proteiniclasticum sp. QWL-01]UUM13014.1 MurR/RpiR family transcriptional regulator [Clostridiaceae bacterium HFYG-1003]WFF71439.1 MurR/RpiR family transcriptional regulator [Proteiniclasticum sp. QWL-01]